MQEEGNEPYKWERYTQTWDVSKTLTSDEKERNAAWEREHRSMVREMMGLDNIDDLVEKAMQWLADTY